MSVADVIGNRSATLVLLDTATDVAVQQEVGRRRGRETISVDHHHAGSEGATIIGHPFGRGENFAGRGVAADCKAHDVGQRLLALSISPVLRRFCPEREQRLDFFLEFGFPDSIFLAEQNLAQRASVQQVLRADDVVLVERRAARDIGIVAQRVAGTGIKPPFLGQDFGIGRADRRRPVCKLIHDGCSIIGHSPGRRRHSARGGLTRHGPGDSSRAEQVGKIGVVQPHVGTIGRRPRVVAALSFFRACSSSAI